ncbi:MAG TPA: tRNA 4-thiouridine(8) synthase ThiI [Syntrophales bacterium]|mgnify:CR=1 FL=1|nr:tRNA 4-thiouridine(8) synthase ThiI [Syntrophales bacterium]
MTRALALFSGGLDSVLAVLVIREQGIDVTGVTFVTPFFGAAKAQAAAERIALPLLVHDFTPDHLRMLKNPRYGYGRNMNPCIDCHTLMLKKAGDLLAETGSQFLITGEVLGQRPMSQTRQSLHIVAKNSGYEGLILRPLSAALLEETIPEKEGLVDRARLLAIQGRGRKTQMDLAGRYGLSHYEPPAGGCLLTDPMFSRRLRHLFSIRPDPSLREIELLKHGRHFKAPADRTIVVGRNSADNRAIGALREAGDDLLRLQGRPGPTVLIPGGGDDETRTLAAALCALYGGAPRDREVPVWCETEQGSSVIFALPLDREEAARLIL